MIRTEQVHLVNDGWNARRGVVDSPRPVQKPVQLPPKPPQQGVQHAPACIGFQRFAVMALKARGNSRVRTVAFDANDQLIADLQHRDIDALVVQNPFLMGYESVKAIGMKLKGQTPPAQVDSGVRLISRFDLEKPEVVELLRPDVQRWLGQENKH